MCVADQFYSLNCSLVERVVVTGGQGFFGAWIAKKLLEDGATPIIMDLKEDNGILEQVTWKGAYASP